MKNARYIIFFIAVPTLYWIFRNKLIEQWNSIESALAILSYATGLFFYTFHTDIKFHFFITRLVSVFKYDHTTWIFSSKYQTEKNKKEIIKLVQEKFGVQNNTIRTVSENRIELFLNNSFLVKISFQSEFDFGYVLLNTSKIIVPSKEISRVSRQIQDMLEGIENAVSPMYGQPKQYDIDIEYRDKSPFYSYWVKKLPEEMIYNFNCNLSLPNNQDSKIKINKNHLIISSHSYSRVFELARDYVSHQAMI